MRRAKVAWAGLGAVLALLVVASVFTVAGNGDVFQVVAFLVLGMPFSVVGALVSARQPAQPIGWLLLGIGVSLALATACDSIVRYGLTHQSFVVGPGYVGSLSAIAFGVFFLLLIALILLLPSGRLPSRQWRIVVPAIALLVAIDLAGIVRPGPLDDWKEEGLRNPLGVEALDAVLAPLHQVGVVLTLLLLAVSILSVAIRFRGSTGVERAQLRWIAATVVATGITWVVTIPGSFILGNGRAADVLWGASLASIAFIPVGIGIAVLRYRLYEIDRLISRTLVYATVTAFLGSAYVGLVLGGQTLFSPFAGGSNLAIAASTLVVAALFLPVRSRVQRFVDRRFYRSRYDAQRTLDAFGTRLREQVALEALRGDLVAVVGETMQPTHVSLWLREAAR